MLCWVLLSQVGKTLLRNLLKKTILMKFIWMKIQYWYHALRDRKMADSQQLFLRIDQEFQNSSSHACLEDRVYRLKMLVKCLTHWMQLNHLYHQLDLNLKYNLSSLLQQGWALLKKEQFEVVKRRKLLETRRSWALRNKTTRKDGMKLSQMVVLLEIVENHLDRDRRC